jgi:hypothetical protein
VADDSTEYQPGFFHRLFATGYPSPRKAVLFGIFPGGGQMYNKKWWKLPIVYGALGTMYYFVRSNRNQYVALRDAYSTVAHGGIVTEKPYSLLDGPTLKSYRDQWRKYSEQSTIWLVILYFASITDAFVDAHLARFDVSDDLTLRVLPKMQSEAFGPSFGMGIQLQVGRTKHVRPYDFNFGQPFALPKP